MALYSYGLYSYGLYSYGLDSYGLDSYGLDSNGTPVQPHTEPTLLPSLPPCFSPLFLVFLFFFDASVFFWGRFSGSCVFSVLLVASMSLRALSTGSNGAKESFFWPSPASPDKTDGPALTRLEG